MNQKYILDTHVLLWFLENNSRLPENIRENIEYMQYEYYISYLSLVEIDNLKKLNKINTKFSVNETIEKMKKSYIGVYYNGLDEIKILDSLEMKTINKKTHGDYIEGG